MVQILVLIVVVESVLLLAVIWQLWRRVARLTGESYDHLHERKAIFSFLEKVGERITSDLDLDGTLEAITEFIVDTTDAESGAIFLLDANRQFLTAKSVYGLFPLVEVKTDRVLTRQKHLKAVLTHARIPIGSGVIGRVASEGAPLLISDQGDGLRIPEATSAVTPIHSMILAPLKIRNRVLGVFALVNKRMENLFSDSDLNLLVSLADQAAVTVDMFSMYKEMAEKRQIEQDLRLASEFQRVLLPQETPQVAGFEFAGYSKAARDIGGDYYDFIRIDDTHIGVVIADVAGKGIPGALVMSMARALLRTVVMESLSPKEVLRRLNRRLLSDTSENVFVTMTYGVLDHRRRVFRFVRCGHEPTITTDPVTGKVNLHIPEGIALGLVGDEMFDVIEEMEIALNPGAMVVLYTDGVIEAMDGNDKEYGQERLLNIIESHRGPVSGLLDSVTKDIERFTRGIPQYDDLTMVAIRACPAEAQAAAKPQEGAREVVGDRHTSEWEQSRLANS